MTRQHAFLRFARGAAALAIVLSALAYGANGVSPSGWATAVRKPAKVAVIEIDAQFWRSIRW
jgi:hypothetical protein